MPPDIFPVAKNANANWYLELVLGHGDLNLDMHKHVAQVVDMLNVSRYGPLGVEMSCWDWMWATSHLGIHFPMCIPC